MYCKASSQGRAATVTESSPEEELPNEGRYPAPTFMRLSHPLQRPISTNWRCAASGAFFRSPLTSVSEESNTGYISLLIQKHISTVMAKSRARISLAVWALVFAILMTEWALRASSGPGLPNLRSETDSGRLILASSAHPQHSAALSDVLQSPPTIFGPLVQGLKPTQPLTATAPMSLTRAERHAIANGECSHLSMNASLTDCGACESPVSRKGASGAIPRMAASHLL